VRTPAGTPQRHSECDRGCVGLQRAPLNDEIPVNSIRRGAGGGNSSMSRTPNCGMREDAHVGESSSRHLVRSGGHKPPSLEAAENRRSVYVEAALGPFVRVARICEFV